MAFPADTPNPTDLRKIKALEAIATSAGRVAEIAELKASNATLLASNTALANRASAANATIEKLREALTNMATQYGCDCNHPACSQCRDTRDAHAALAQLKETTDG